MANQIALRVLTTPGGSADRRGADPHPDLRGGRAGGPLRADGPAADGTRRPDHPRADPRVGRHRATGSSRRGSSSSSRRIAAPAGASGRLDELAASIGAAHELGLPVHLDGARLMNASVAVRHPGRRVRAARRHRADLLLEGTRLRDGRDPGRLRRADRGGLAAEVPVRRRAPPGRRRRGGDALRARPQRRAPRRGPRAGEAPGRGPRGRRTTRRRRRDRDELRRHRRRLDRHRRRGRAGTHRGARASSSAVSARASCASPPTSASSTTTSTRRSSSSPGRSVSSQQPEHRLSEILRRGQARYRLPSVSAAVYRGGEVVWADAVGIADGGARRDARHPVPHRLDHEDVHRGGGDAPRRGGEARAGRPARAAPAGGAVRRPDRSQAARAQLGPPARAARRGLGVAPVPERRRAGRPPRRRRARAPARRALALLEPRVRAARRGRRARRRTPRSPPSSTSG